MTETVESAHAWRIDEREYERHELRRGRRFAYESIDPSRTALVVVDLVRFFADESSYVRGIIPNVNRIAAKMRTTGGPVIWVVPGRQRSPSAWEVGFYGEQAAAKYATSGGGGTPVDSLAPGLDISPDDHVVEKFAASALFPGRSDVHSILQELGITGVLIAGTVTSVCCESTARDASTLGYEVVVLADATADVSDAAHNASLRIVYRSFGDVRATNDVIALIDHASNDGT